MIETEIEELIKKIYAVEISVINNITMQELRKLTIDEAEKILIKIDNAKMVLNDIKRGIQNPINKW